jgi:hypothetical protein
MNAQLIGRNDSQKRPAIPVIANIFINRVVLFVVGKAADQGFMQDYLAFSACIL